ncbi:MAG: hypothetical protein HOQ45_12060 [Nocardioidaceae bacterium]|nr:hypothetical protein [Nocardioidaceae bacterium]
MHIVIPPGQTLSDVSVEITILRTEAAELRDALDRVLATNDSSWQVTTTWAEQETDVRMRLILQPPLRRQSRRRHREHR